VDNPRQQCPHPIRDPALKQLAAESPSFAKQHAEDAPAVRRVREEYQREILSLPGIRSHLEKLKARGVKSERALMYLAALAQLETDATWQLKTEEIKTNLRKLAGRLQSIADEVEKEYSSDTIRPDLWAISLGVLSPPVPRYDHRKAVECMQETAADLETKARRFGRLRKETRPAVKRAPIVALLRCVCKPEPRSVPECPPELRDLLVELLYSVCERYGIKKSFTAESLLKTFNRHVLSGPSK
jgi:hypothetical protein